MELAEKIAAFPQETVRRDRRAVYDGLGRGIDEGLKIEALHGNRSMSTAVDGAERFAEDEVRGGEGM